MKKFLIGFLILGLIGWAYEIITGEKISSEPPKVEKKIEQQKQTQPPPPPPKIVNLNMTQAQFIQAFNNQSAAFGTAGFLFIGATTDKQGVQNTFQFLFSQQTAIIGSVDPSTNLLKEVMILTQPQNQDGVAEMLMAYGLVMAVLNPELSQEQRAALLKEIYLTPEGLIQLNSAKGTAFRGNVRYVTQKVQNGMYQLIASAKDL